MGQNAKLINARFVKTRRSPTVVLRAVGVPISLPFGSFISQTTCRWFGIVTNPYTMIIFHSVNSCQEEMMTSLYLSGFSNRFQSLIVPD